MDDRAQLRIYLSERIALVHAAMRLARRMRGGPAEPGMAPLLGEALEALADDAATLTSFLRQVGAAPPRLRIAGAAAAERLGRFKLNGRVAGRSRLADLQELDGMLALLGLAAGAWAAIADAGVAADEVVDGREDRLRDLAGRLAAYRRGRAVGALAAA
ncbi:MAG: hypothetical protein IT200_07075 [Thermoleophilia bacterium]|nr:hypothetical protein [Thermoleophilia bacterium]